MKNFGRLDMIALNRGVAAQSHNHVGKRLTLYAIRPF
jgi:hypothetical protein